VVDRVSETARASSILLDLPEWPGHRAGQHVDIRLTADDGYQAQRSYSIASAPEDGLLALTVERLDDGEVSPYLTDVLEPGDELELRGPIGGYFVWETSLPGPLQLIAGGSGIVPLRAILRHWSAADRPVEARLLYSVRSLDDAIYREELLELAGRDGVDLSLALTRAWPSGWPGHRGRIDRAYLDAVTWPPQERPRIYVCGPTTFVEVVAELLVEGGHPPDSIRTERFGATGG
jgi:ferredoxin-NADP reductase